MPISVLGHLASQEEDCPPARICEIIFPTIALIATASDVATTIVNPTLDFDASATAGMSKVKTIPF
jgi:hypothetical protein